MKNNSAEELNYSILPEKREPTMEKIRRTNTFHYFIEERSFEEQECLFKEIENVLENGVPFKEYLSTGMNYSHMIGETDYRKVALFCLAESFNEVMSENRETIKSVEQNSHFKEIYNDVFSQIVSCLQNKRSDFPKEALHCLFLLTDEDLDPHRQGLIAARLTLECFCFCSSDQQRGEIEELVKECMI